MNTSAIILGVLALLPAAALMFYIYKMDRAEKEPAGLLIGIFFLGVLSIVPTFVFEIVLGNGLDSIFFPGVSQPDPESLSIAGQHGYQLINNFICIALVEEFFKWLFCFLLTHKNKNFNSLFDGVIYMAVAALGFAAAENLLYVFQNGMATALLRMITAVPGHFFDGVIMGYFYSRWALEKRADNLEKHLAAQRIIPAGSDNFKPAKYLILSIAVPTIAHGFYDFSLSMGLWVYLIAFFIFLIALYIICFVGVHRFSKKDNVSSYLSMDMVLKQYPDAAAYVSTLPEFAPYFAPPVTQTAGYGQPFAPPIMMGQPYMPPMPGYQQAPVGAQPYAPQQAPMGAQPYAPQQGYQQAPTGAQPFTPPTQGQAPDQQGGFKY